MEYWPALCDFTRHAVFIWSGGLCTTSTGLAKMTIILDFIRCCGVCGILTSLVLFYQKCSLYMVWWTLYNIHQPCVILPDMWKTTRLVRFVWSYKFTDFAEYLPAFRTFTGLMHLIRSCYVSILSTSFAWFTRPVKNFRGCELCIVL